MLTLSKKANRCLYNTVVSTVFQVSSNQLCTLVKASFRSILLSRVPGPGPIDHNIIIIMSISASTACNNFAFMRIRYPCERLRERLEMQEGSSSLLASTSACYDSAIMIPYKFYHSTVALV